MKRGRNKKVSVEAKCASFDIAISAQFQPRGLAASEVDDVKRKLTNELTRMIAKLPFSHIYPCEVSVR